MLLNLLVALLHFLFQFRFLVEELFLYFEQFLLFDDFGFLLGLFNDFPILACRHIAEHCETHNASHNETGYGDYDFHTFYY